MAFLVLVCLETIYCSTFRPKVGHSGKIKLAWKGRQALHNNNAKHSCFSESRSDLNAGEFSTETKFDPDSIICKGEHS